MTENEVIKPWYRQPWFWFLVLFPAMSIGYCAVAITLAITTENSMVTDDYSREGRGINQLIARDTMARDMGLNAMLLSQGRDFELELSRDNGAADYDYLILKLYHPTLEDRDRVAQLRRVGPGKYTAQVPGNIDGRWYLELNSPSNEWRLQGEGFLPAENQLQLKPDLPERG
ncbi:FixH family protein [uncultured Marinobacter sp.]|uniref:FixH family protein n=1 Tax=uncultured Marinobacter sp. TaxID=187379 RepID=UPI0030D919E6